MVDVVFLGMNDVGEKIHDWLTEQGDTNIERVVKTKDGLGTIKETEPDLVVSAGFRHIVPQEILEIPKRGAVNVHKSYLPYNRGANPNVWSIVEDNPAGVSIHYMTTEIDGGPIIDRRKVPTYPHDNGRDLYERLEKEQIKQFKQVWPDIKKGNPDTLQPDIGKGTYHKKKDFVDLWELDLNEEIEVGDLIDRLRALTFPPYNNAYFQNEDGRYYVEINIIPEEEAHSNEESELNIPEYEEGGTL